MSIELSNKKNNNNINILYNMVSGHWMALNLTRWAFNLLLYVLWVWGFLLLVSLTDHMHTAV